jgi:hypothetical protein
VVSLYANATKLWGDEGFSQVCSTVRNMIDALYEALPQVRALIDAGTILQALHSENNHRLRAITQHVGMYSLLRNPYRPRDEFVIVSGI